MFKKFKGFLLSLTAKEWSNLFLIIAFIYVFVYFGVIHIRENYARQAIILAIVAFVLLILHLVIKLRRKRKKTQRAITQTAEFLFAALKIMSKTHLTLYSFTAVEDYVNSSEVEFCGKSKNVILIKTNLFKQDDPEKDTTENCYKFRAAMDKFSKKHCEKNRLNNKSIIYNYIFPFRVEILDDDSVDIHTVIVDSKAAERFVKESLKTPKMKIDDTDEDF